MACHWTQRGQSGGRGWEFEHRYSVAGTAQGQANFSGNESKSGHSVEELEAEIRRLRTENAKLLEQREV